jgi:TRAP-type uncharacterized transport system substrate-binding protein
MRSTAANEIAPSDSLHPYHPGAVMYYKEVGLWTDAHDQNQQRLLAMQ